MADSVSDDQAGAAAADLHAQHIACPQCGADLFRVDHAPQYEDVVLYCTACARRAEVAFDDPVYQAIVADAGAEREGREGRAGRDMADVLRAVEERLRPCDCGGAFRAEAPRRCAECDGVVLADEPGVDLWPGYCDFDMEQRMPRAEDVERINAFDASHIRRADLWR